MITYINNKKKFTAKEIADEFNMSIRTAHRYLLEVSEMGIPLYTEPGKYGGYRVLENKLLPPILFSEEEVLSIYFSYQALDYYENIPFDINSEIVKDKLYASLPEDSKNMINQYNKFIKFWNPKRNKIEVDLITIVHASIESEILFIEYTSLKGTSTRKVVPIGLYSYSGNWYMPSFDLSKKEQRIFRVDKIKKIMQTNEFKKIDQNLDLIDFLNNHISNKNNSV